MPILFDAGASAGCRKFLNSPVKNLQLFLFVCFDGNPCIVTEKKEKVTNILLICRGGLFFCKQNVQNAHSDFEPQTYPECLWGVRLQSEQYRLRPENCPKYRQKIFGGFCTVVYK